ncbi:L,D-transpeptidase family protein [Streptomyces longispororuber]|uniref:L,D-transpeptidase family protein n=1 Tax=Streptomyces longispororuber TaxID=68230 RepID=UPI00210BD770|nr:L,D-transpeptidase family protein [Streptomyces longispororuber]MCQ4210570.1 hypothetical protein [Streptomyces longispororuber]
MPSRLHLAVFLAAGLLLTGCSDSTTTARAIPRDPAQHAPAPSPVRAEQAAAPKDIPGLGPRTLSRIPAAARQAIVVTGDGANATTGTAQRYVRDATTGWRRLGTPWPTRNALKGWTAHHVQGDLRTPSGVFGLTDAGGHEPNPGTELPYDTGPAFVARGTNAEGEPLGDAFDYVVAINYNRKPGTTPLDWTRPLGMNRGGGIWFHVDHGGPTQGCVTLPKPRMRELLRWLDKESRPVVVMGDKTTLER